MRAAAGESVLSRVIRILETFGSDVTVLSVSQIARRSGLHVATVSRLVEQMTRLGLLQRDGRSVRIGVRMWELGSRASPTVGLREAAMPFMEDLHAVVGHHIQLGVREGDEVLFVERLAAPGAVINYTRVAGRLPLHASSSGLVLCAHAPADVQERVIAGPLRTYTEHTIGTPRRLRSFLAQVRRQGYAFCQGHIHPDAAGIAVPLHDARRRVVAALAAIVPNDENARAQIPALRAAARGISRAMAGREANGT
ncbi:IclR family transcriptional regulator [Streptomyces sp. HNM0575]|uniref:IclR family transcriptional regulator n=1 Tax=Streptomyces sp. HNM0575 TaxID=2716338 RepID=UPI00145D8F64|nr:IclR family transcriptional regulator [Streptomyces sp. HNM0575]NLU73920.1 IclR family transcriptional regulator [Streptomyces sp. HNM0575]